MWVYRHVGWGGVHSILLPCFMCVGMHVEWDALDRSRFACFRVRTHKGPTRLTRLGWGVHRPSIHDPPHHTLT